MIAGRSHIQRLVSVKFYGLNVALHIKCTNRAAMEKKLSIIPENFLSSSALFTSTLAIIGNYAANIETTHTRSIDIRKGDGLATLFNTIHDLWFSYFE